MNAPRPVLTSSTSASMPSAIFLLMIDARDQRDALDRAGHVAQGVELLVGRRDLGGLADHGAADVAEHALELVERQAGAKARGSLRACRACRRCARGRGPTSSARPRRTPPRAARGSATSCRRRRRCCACRPSRPGMSDRSTRTPERTIASVRRGLLGRHAAQDDRHQQGGDLVVGQRPVRHAARRRPRSLARRRPAVPLVADHIDSTHGPRLSILRRL